MIQVYPIVIHKIGTIGQLKEVMKLHVLHRLASVILDIKNYPANAGQDQLLQVRIGGFSIRQIAGFEVSRKLGCKRGFTDADRAFYGNELVFHIVHCSWLHSFHNSFVSLNAKLPAVRA